MGIRITAMNESRAIQYYINSDKIVDIYLEMIDVDKFDLLTILTEKSRYCLTIKRKNSSKSAHRLAEAMQNKEILTDVQIFEEQGERITRAEYR